MDDIPMETPTNTIWPYVLIEINITFILAITVVICLKLK